MASYSLIARRAGQNLGQVTALDVRLSLHLDRPSTLQFTVDGDDQTALFITELETDILVYRDDRLILRTVVVSVRDEVSPSDHKVAVGAVDYRGRLQRRLVLRPEPFDNVGDVDIAWSVIESIQSEVDGDLGITRGFRPNGIGLTGIFEVGVPVYDALQILSESGQGFDWDVSPDLVFNIFRQRGQNRGRVLDYGGLASEVRQDFAVERFANVVRAVGSDETSPVVVTPPFSPSVVAYGGQIADIEDGGVTYRTHTFFADGEFTLETDDTPVEYLIVGGGGGGGSFTDAGGGGGAGGLLTNLGSPLVTEVGTYPVKVGGGGVGGVQLTVPSTSGGDSSALGVTAFGGGKGGDHASLPENGGSGGGARGQTNQTTIGLGTAGQGNNGGIGTTSSTSSNRAAGGGGGAGAVGANATTSSGGNGGVGLASTIYGTSAVFAGGGGGGKRGLQVPGLGGAGGGGDSANVAGVASDTADASPGVDGLGGGGGGSRLGKAGDGGSGIVVIRYALPPAGPQTATGRWETQVSYTDVNNQRLLVGLAIDSQDRLSSNAVGYSVRLRESEGFQRWRGETDIWLGDVVRLVVKTGRLDVNEVVRVYEIAVTVREDGAEQVTFTLAGPKPTFADRIDNVLKKLGELERR